MLPTGVLRHRGWLHCMLLLPMTCVLQATLSAAHITTRACLHRVRTAPHLLQICIQILVLIQMILTTQI